MSEALFFFFFFILLVHLVVISAASPSAAAAAAAACSVSEATALRNATQNLHNLNASWSGPSLDCCSWYGVTCASSDSGSSSSVIAVSLAYSNLSGTLSSGFFFLPSLQSLNLSHNNLSGPLPPDLITSFSSNSNSSSLISLDLSSNNLSGNFPANLPPSLRLLNLSANSLTGPLRFSSSSSPFNNNNNSNLTTLWLSFNSLHGDLSSVAAACLDSPNLHDINLSNNNLSGNISPALASCSTLQSLDLSHNSLSGILPDNIFHNLTSLTTLSLSSNYLHGPFPSSVGSLLRLSTLLLSNNLFNASLPSNLSSCTQLRVFTANSNYFSGTLLSFPFDSFPLLENLDLNTNLFSGSIPPSLSHCFSLKSLNLAKNSLTGTIPSGFHRLPSLTTFLISSNSLNGSLLSLDGCQHLVSLIISKNNFSESIPQSMLGLTNLQLLALGNLQLRGSIPPWLRNCTKLQVLDLSWNRLTGPIPPWIGQLPHLFYLDLSNNSLSGFIPPELFSLAALIHPDTNLTGLQTVVSNLAIKQTVDAPQLLYSQVSAFPPSIYLSHNLLQGAIPRQVGAFAVLLDMDLSFNNLSGAIPDTIANMTDLERLDLSYNNLSGRIPSSLARLTFLSYFNVSYNRLEGPIPEGTQFSTFSNKSYDGNPRLCGPPLTVRCGGGGETGSSASSSSGKKRWTAERVAILITATLVSAVAVAAAVICVVWKLSRRSVVYQGSVSFDGRSGSTPNSKWLSQLMLVQQGVVGDSQVELFYYNKVAMGRGKLTLLDLIKATNNFDEAHIVGCGGFGLVYRADLADGSKLAIKKLTGGDRWEMEREFRAEVEALSKAQHQNLVPLEGYLQVGDEKLLLYTYMENGNLDYWLHERSDDADDDFFLDWPMRLRIAQGAAHGLAYLHQTCDPHIVHRDIKSSNILLDASFRAHLADFGLARLMMTTDTHVTTEVVGTLGYIPPEYGLAVNATPKGDIYSFGVVLLELLTRKRPVDLCSKGGEDLVKWVIKCKQAGKAEEIFDAELRSKGYEEQMMLVLDVACNCLHSDPTKRPLISDVVRQLDGIMTTTTTTNELLLTHPLVT